MLHTLLSRLTIDQLFNARSRKKTSYPRSRDQRRANRPLPIESLEDRRLLTVTIQVTDVSDSALRGAIQQANEGSDDFVLELSAGRYETIAFPPDMLANILDNANEKGDFDIDAGSRSITIQGESAATTVIDAAGVDRVFHVLSGQVIFRDLTIRGGRTIDDGESLDQNAFGGGVLVESGANVTFDHVTIADNRAKAVEPRLEGGVPPGRFKDAFGGGVALKDGANATFLDSTLHFNVAQASYGKDGVSGDLTTPGEAAGNGFGGGVYLARGSLTMTHCTLTENVALGGIGGEGGSGQPEFRAIVGGVAGADAGDGGDGSGGGLYLGGGTIQIIDSLLSQNTAAGLLGGFGGGGGGGRGDSNPNGGNGGDGGDGGDSFGGGIFLAAGNLTLLHSQLVNNQATAEGSGGGDGGGGGAGVGVLAVQDGLGGDGGTGGSAYGGGLYVAGGSASMTNSTLSENHARIDVVPFTAEASQLDASQVLSGNRFTQTFMVLRNGYIQGVELAVEATSTLGSLTVGYRLIAPAAAALGGSSVAASELPRTAPTLLQLDTVTGFVVNPIQQEGLRVFPGYVIEITVNIDSDDIHLRGNGTELAFKPFIRTVSGGSGGAYGGRGGDSGRANGGGIYFAGGVLALTDTLVRKNDALGGGGRDGYAGRDDESVSATSGGGGGRGGDGQGGGLYLVNGTLAGGDFVDNRAAGGRGGDGGQGGFVTLAPDLSKPGGFGGHGGDGQGGGIFAVAGMLGPHSVTGNSAVAGDGGNGGPGSSGDPTPIAGTGGDGGDAHGGGIFFKQHDDAIDISAITVTPFLDLALADNTAGPGARGIPAGRDGRAEGNNVFPGISGVFATIGNRVWHDRNRNGQQDPGEEGVPDVLVRLFASGGTPLDNTRTDAMGLYQFKTTFAGSVFVQFELSPQTGTTFTQVRIGGDSIDSDADPATGRTRTFEVATGATFNDIDAGLLTPPALGPIIVTGTDAGGGPNLRVFDADTNEERFSFFVYSPAFTGGVRVATGDVNGDGIQDIITAAGPGGGPHVRVFDGATGAQIPGTLGSFFVYAPNVASGVFVAAGDVNGDGRDDIVTAAGAGGGPHVKVFSGVDGSVLWEFFAYDVTYTGGVTVAVGDVDGDGKADIITGTGPNGGPHLKVFSSATHAEMYSFFAYAPTFTGGLWVAAGDANGDGKADIFIGAGQTGGPHVRVLSGANLAVLHNFFAYAPTFTGGIRVAAGDLDGDGLADIITGAGPTGGPHVRGLSGINRAELASFFAYDPSFTGGIFVAGSTGGGAGLRLAGEAAGFSSNESLNDDQLTLIRAAAISRWQQAGLPDDQLMELASVRFAVANLPGNLLGQVRDEEVLIDRDAAGRGWFVDPTPNNDEEFQATSPVSSQVDLLSVVLHEMGHQLGLDHDDDTGVDLMAAELSTGIRRLPTANLVDELLAAW